MTVAKPAADLPLLDPLYQRLVSLGQQQIDRFEALLADVESLKVDPTWDPAVQGSLASAIRSAATAGGDATSSLLTLKGDLQLEMARTFLPAA